jgi:hypothetical protein
MIWKPVAVIGVFATVRAFVHRALTGTAQRRAAILLALLYVGPGQLIAQALARVGSSGRFSFPWTDVTLDPWIGWWSWGYPFGLIAVACMLAALLAYSAQQPATGSVMLSALLGALASWLHPWQGATLIVTLLVSEVGSTRGRPRVRPLVLVCLATALPLAYYVALGRLDPAWRSGQSASHGSWPLWALAICELPLVVPAAFAYRRSCSFEQWAIRAWPIAALAVFLVAQSAGGGFALHAFLGVNIPLGVLAVEGWARAGLHLRYLRRPAVAGLACAAVTVPALADQLRWAHQQILRNSEPPAPQGHGNAQFVTRGEQAALAFLARDPAPGGVLTRSYLGTIVPAESGRSTYVGDAYWSPDFAARQATANALFSDQMSPAESRSFVRRTGARFLLDDCASARRLGLRLAPLIRVTRRFGCTEVYVLR